MKNQKKYSSDRIDPPKPLRPHNGYHLFFKLERYSILAEKNHLYLAEDEEIDQNAHLRPEKYRGIALPKHWFVKEQKKKRKDHVIHGVISFIELSKEMSRRWQEADDETKRFCNGLAKSQLKIYYQQMKDYKEKYGKKKPDDKHEQKEKRKDVNNHNSPNSPRKATKSAIIPSIGKKSETDVMNLIDNGFDFEFDSSIPGIIETETTHWNTQDYASKNETPIEPRISSKKKEEGTVFSTNDTGYVTASAVAGATTSSSDDNQWQDFFADLEPIPITSDTSKIKVVPPMEASQMTFPVDGEAQRFLTGLFSCNRLSQTNKNINDDGLGSGVNSISTLTLGNTESEFVRHAHGFHFPFHPQQQQVNDQQNLNRTAQVYHYPSAPIEVRKSPFDNSAAISCVDAYHRHQYQNQTINHDWSKI